MRKLLLATTAALGASVAIAGGAYAGTLTANAPNPAPGSISVTFNTVVEAFVFNGSDTGKVRAESVNGLGLNAAGNRSPAASSRRATGSAATSVCSRPSPACSANGLQYGASAEFRQTSGFSNKTSNPVAATVYNQRAFLYVGADKFGKVYLGSQVQPTELFQTGNPANFNTGGWDGDLPGDLRHRPAVLHRRLRTTRRTRSSTSRRSSPASTSASRSSPTPTAATSVARSTRAFPSTPATQPQYGNRINTVDGSLRYQGSFGPFGIKSNVGGSVGGTVKASDGTPNHQSYTLLAGGLGVTYGGLELDGHIDAGHFNSSFQPEQARRAHHDVLCRRRQLHDRPGDLRRQLLRLRLRPVKDGVDPVGTLHGYGIAAGGTYTLAPGASVFLEYLYGHQRANGYDLINGAVNTAGTGPKSTTTSRSRARHRQRVQVLIGGPLRLRRALRTI